MRKWHFRQAMRDEKEFDQVKMKLRRYMCIYNKKLQGGEEHSGLGWFRKGHMVEL